VMRLSVHDVIRSASTAITDANFKLLEFERVFPAQVRGLLLLLTYCQLPVVSPISQSISTFIGVVICPLEH